MSNRFFLIPAVLCVLFAATACLPTLRTNPRFVDCKITYFDTRVAGGQQSPLKPYLDEVTAITGMKFERASGSTGANLVIGRITGGDPYVMGQHSVTGSKPGAGGRTTIVSSRINYRNGSSPGILRHELGHLFNLAHNPRSTLMQPSPATYATYSAAERVMMRDMAKRSTCKQTVSFG